ncbi:MAG: hypothetical protein ABIE94_05625 [archaeon]
MQLKPAIERLEASSKFKKFKKTHPDFYLVHAFMMVEEGLCPWQIGYYSKKKDRIVVFDVAEDIKMSPESEVFKKGGSVKKIDLTKINISFDKALEIAEKHVKEKYSGEPVNKRFAILQELERLLWNVTFVTAAFNLINMKLDAETGDLFHDERTSILNLGKQ